MKLLFALINIVVSDNIEIATSDFDILNFKGKTIKSTDITDGNSIKLSHLGNSVYLAIEVLPRVFEIVDKTIYFREMNPATIRIDVERKIFGLADFVWPFLIFNVLFGIFSWMLVSVIIKRLCEKYIPLQITEYTGSIC